MTWETIAAMPTKTLFVDPTSDRYYLKLHCSALGEDRLWRIRNQKSRDAYDAVGRFIRPHSEIISRLTVVQ